MIKKIFHIGMLTSLFFATNISYAAVNEQISLYLDQFGFKIPVNEKLVFEDNKVYLPLSCIEKITPYSHVISDNRLEITIPQLHVKNNELIVENYDNGYRRELPIVTINNKPMIDSKYLGYYLGIKKQEEQGSWILSPLKGRIPAIEKEPLHGKIALSFDPMASNEVEYKEPFDKQGTSIISPSFFALTKTGVKKENIFSSDYVKKYEKNGFKVWPLITNQFDPKLTHEIVNDKTSWDKYVVDLGNLALKEGYEGYNFDFENVYYEDRDNLGEFVKHLSSGLSNFGLYTSMDVTGYSDSLRWSKVYDRKKLSTYVDYLVLMAYDEVGRGSKIAGPVASYPWVKNNLSIFVNEVPPEKTLLGIPLYMREWRKNLKDVPMMISDNSNNFLNPLDDIKTKGFLVKNDGLLKLNKDKTNVNETEFTSKIAANNIKNDFNLDKNVLNKVTPKAFTMSIKRSYDIKKEFAKDVVWLPELELHYLEYTKDGYFTQIWFEDEDSLLKKLKLAHEFNIAGVAFWRKDFEDEQTHSFIKKNLFKIDSSYK